MMMINPGAGPITPGTLAHACTNMDRLIEDAGLEGARYYRNPTAAEADGRFAFDVATPGYSERQGTVRVDMPGLPIERVRYLGEPQDAFAFPRLYVDGSSWLWVFAARILGSWKREHEESEEETRQRMIMLRGFRLTPTAAAMERERAR